MKADYTIDNVRLVAASINVAMGEWGEEVFFNIATAALRERERNETLQNHAR